MIKRVISPERLMNAAIIDRVYNPEKYLFSIGKTTTSYQQAENGETKERQRNGYKDRIVKDVGKAFYKQSGEKWPLWIHKKKTSRYYKQFLDTGLGLLEFIKTDYPGATNPLYWLARDWFKAIFKARKVSRKYGARVYGPNQNNWRIFDIWVSDYEKETGKSYWVYEPVDKGAYDRKEQVIKQRVKQTIAKGEEARKQAILSRLRLQRDMDNASTPEEKQKVADDMIAGVYDSTERKGK